MTNEEIIKGLQAVNEHIGKHFNEGGAWMAEFIDNAIKALEQTELNPSYNGVKSELDCISREEALKVMCDKCPMYNCVTGCSSYRHIEKMPSVQPQPKRGKWKRVVDKTGHWVWECDDCEWQQRFATNYCPDCGADMEVKKYEDG